MNVPKFSFRLNYIDKNLYRLDVIAENIPQKFLGTAFQVVIDGDDWGYQRYELGPIFQKPSNVIGLTTQREKPREIVFGITMKRGFSIEMDHGVLASFYLNISSKDVLNFEFQKGVLSILDNHRKDIHDVTWENAKINLQNLQPQETVLKDEKTDISSPNENLSQTEVVTQQTFENNSNASIQNEQAVHNNQGFWVLVFLFSFFIMAFVLIFIRKKYLKP